jgi:hypothetical protein
MYQELYRELKDVTTNVCEEFSRRFRHEGIYSFNLYTEPLFGYLVDNLLTERGLEQVAREYVSQYAGRPGYEMWWTVESATRSLRWSPPDSPHHALLDDRFHVVNALLTEIWENVDRDTETNSTCRNIFETCVDVLVGIRKAGIFEKSVLLNIVCGDESYEERVVKAERINEPSVAARYAADMKLDPLRLAQVRRSYARR